MVLNYFNYGGKEISEKESAGPKKTPVRALPASWYNSKEMYEFERRAIFSRRWLFLTHRLRLKEPGSFVRYNIAGYDLMVVRDRTGNIQAFHNVCRHRAYPVVEQEEGKKSILACRYHGWSYGLNGKLAKAPGYQTLDAFEKEQNGLLRIHTKVDRNGFVWINMDANETPEVSWEEHFENVDVQERYKDIDFDDYELDHVYQLDGDYNWKILADNFNECYHCPTTHADIPEFLNLESFDSDLKDGHIQHHCVATPEQAEKGLHVHSTYYFPNASSTIGRHFIMVQKFLPRGPGQSTMYYEIYRNRHSSDSDFRLISDMYARVMAEDKVLCDQQQKNLNAGVFVNGQLHPKFEKAPLFFQSTVRQVVTEHFEKEKKAGRELWPARMRVPHTVGLEITSEDERICEVIVGMCSAGAGREEILAW